MTLPPPSVCPGQEELVHRWLDGELSPTERASFDPHLSACPACQTLLSEIETVFASLESLSSVAPPAGLVTEVMAGLPESGPTARGLTPGHWLLGLQLLIGVVLLGLAWPLLTSLLDQAYAIWQPWWLLWPELLPSGEWLTTLTRLSPPELPPLEFSTADLLGFSISPELGLGVAVVLIGLWLVGNGLLLRRQSASFKNGGVS